MEKQFKFFSFLNKELEILREVPRRKECGKSKEEMQQLI